MRVLLILFIIIYWY